MLLASSFVAVCSRPRSFFSVPSGPVGYPGLWKRDLVIFRPDLFSQKKHRLQPVSRLTWRISLTVAAMLFYLCGAVAPGHANTRIKDITSIEGVRDNLLVGYGLVVGLNGSGDDLGSAIFTRESLIGVLERLGVNARDAQLDSDNVAAVIVTANLPPFARQGSRIDITVSTIGDADSLLGGTLLVTPLLGADGKVYAVGQGGVVVSGFNATGQGTQVSQGVPTAGRIPNGAIIEQETGYDLRRAQHLRLALNNPDFTTAARLAGAINSFMRQDLAEVTDPTTVALTIPDDYEGGTIAFLTQIEQLTIAVDQPAHVVIDESSGIVVIGSQVRISPVAIAQGNLTVRITEQPIVSQPPPFAPQGASTEVLPRTEVIVDTDSERRLGFLPEAVSLQELVNGLNALGTGPRDLISILQAIKAAGALQAEISLI